MNCERGGPLATEKHEPDHADVGEPPAGAGLFAAQPCDKSED